MPYRTNNVNKDFEVRKTYHSSFIDLEWAFLRRLTQAIKHIRPTTKTIPHETKIPTIALLLGC